MYKIKFIFTCLTLFITCVVSGQAKKPTLMVVPSDAWCIQHGYVQSFDDQGTEVDVPDYKRAFQNNPEVLQVISQINGMMAERGFPLKNMESAIKTLQSNSAEDMLGQSKSGGGIRESPIDALKKAAKADIIIQLTWTINNVGPKKSVNFNLQGLDAYTDKQIATATGTGAPSFSAAVPVLLSEAVISHMDNFTSSLQDYFDDMFENGREIIVRIQTWDNWEGDLEQNYGGGDELGYVIENWIRDHSVKGRFNTTDFTENMMLFEQVRIPLFDASNHAIDARRYLRDLSRYLSAAPFNIPNKLVMKGLGRATIILGSK
jgi:hypothetical protein